MCVKMKALKSSWPLFDILPFLTDTVRHRVQVQLMNDYVNCVNDCSCNNNPSFYNQTFQNFGEGNGTG